ncbi:hypothetical protein PT282_00990 [Bifidobacterium sp. ESL0763]|uniref:hypothetical protein n=1 Tax=Bifidobacterium sp. ESL0763 TaxID=2983227 RepID=UPI0023F98FCE|nr:hypothetical protein [Bifidobacterium sp. ESL0763]MDF7663258.1 hypothetical protein [Bifidobacterium sp. ESL0763]
MAKQQKVDEYKNAITVLDTDFSYEVTEAYQTARTQFDKIQQMNLSGPDRALPSELRNNLENLNTTFRQQIPQKQAQIQPARQKAEQQHTIFLVVQIALIVLGVLLCFTGSGTAATFGVIMVIAGIICHFVFKSKSAKAVQGLAADWRAFFDYYAEVIGHPESLHEMATGLYKQIDDVYLKSLDNISRGFEIQQRQMNKQAQAQAEQSRQALALQQQQLAAMDNITDAVIGTHVDAMTKFGFLK